MINGCSDDISIYFHMKNHYTKLRNVKSTLHSSLGFPKSGNGSPHAVKSYVPNHHYATDRPTKNSCNILHKFINVGTKSDTHVRPVQLPPRPTTRRHPYETPNPSQKTRSQSVGSLTKNSILQKGTQQIKRRKKSKNIVTTKDDIIRKSGDNLRSCIQNHDNDKNRRSGKIEYTKSKTEEHEYLQFVLSVTEDIIMNDYVINEDLLRLFDNHLEANKGRLDRDKMEYHLMMLAKELQVPYKNSINLSPVQKPEIPAIRIVDGNCECTAKRSLELIKTTPIFCSSYDYKEGDTLVVKHSLSRVTECTEPTNSVDTIFNASTKFPSVTTVSSFGNVDILPCFENVDLDKKYSDIVTDEKNETKNILNSLTFIGTNRNNLIAEKSDIQLSDNNSQNIVNGTIDQNSSHSSIHEPIQESSITVNTTESSTEGCDSENTVIRNISCPADDCQEQAIWGKCEIDIQNLLTPTPVRETREHILDPKIKVRFIEHKSTQKSADLVDKGCCTADFLFKERNQNDYVLIDKPVYVMKKILEADEKYILLRETISKTCESNESYKDFEESRSNIQESLSQNISSNICKDLVLEKNKSEHSVTSEEPSMDAVFQGQHEHLTEAACHVGEEKHLSLKETSASENTLNLSDYSMKSLSELDSYYMAKMNYSKLLTSDYDLTPQRDNPSSTDKYHHLLVDAMTSISNINLGSKNLLLTEDYAMPNIGQNIRILERNASHTNLDVKKGDCLLDAKQRFVTVENKSNNEIDKYILNSDNSESTVKSNTDRYELIQGLNRSATFFVNSKNEMRSLKNIISNINVPSSTDTSSIGYFPIERESKIHEHIQTDKTQIDISTSTSSLL